MRFFVFALVSVLALVSFTVAEDSRIGGTPVYHIQPMGHVSGGAFSYTSNSWNTTNQAGKRTVAVGVDVADTSTGGNLVVHLKDDYNVAGAAVLCTLEIPASNGVTQRIGMVFDRIDSLGTTIKRKGLHIWF